MRRSRADTSSSRAGRLEVVEEHFRSEAEQESDRIVNERVSFDSAGLLRQIGREELLALAGA